MNAKEAAARIYTARHTLMEERYVDIADMHLWMHPQAWGEIRLTAKDGLGYPVCEWNPPSFYGFKVELDDRLGVEDLVFRSEVHA